MSAALGRHAVVRPQPKAAEESLVVVSCATAQRQNLEFLDVPTADHGVLGLQRVDQALHDIDDMPPPLLLAVAFQTSQSEVVLVSALPIGQVSEFHRLQ